MKKALCFLVATYLAGPAAVSNATAATSFYGNSIHEFYSSRDSDRKNVFIDTVRLQNYDLNRDFKVSWEEYKAVAGVWFLSSIAGKSRDPSWRKGYNTLWKNIVTSGSKGAITSELGHMFSSWTGGRFWRRMSFDFETATFHSEPVSMTTNIDFPEIIKRVSKADSMRERQLKEPMPSGFCVGIADYFTVKSRFATRKYFSRMPAIDSFDLNRDEKVTPEEFQARLRIMFMKIDGDADGILSRDEIRRACEIAEYAEK